MKKFLTIFFSLIFVAVLSGCAEKTNTDLSAEETKASSFVENSAENFAEVENFIEDFEGNSTEDAEKNFVENGQENSIEVSEGNNTENSMEVSELNKSFSDNMISSKMLSHDIYDALQAEWSAWNAKDDFQKAVSSKMPGHVYKQFNTWAECEKFVGFELFNPLENSEFEKGSYVGMPVGFNDASRFYVSFYGESPENVNWIHVESGYRDGDVRITVNTQIFPDTPKENLDMQESVITADSGERYVAMEAVLVHESLTYNIRVIGSSNQWEKVRETMKKVLPYFDTMGNGNFSELVNNLSISELSKLAELSSLTETLNMTENTESTEMVVEKKSILDFLKIAMQPVGKTMYVYGGGWNEEDTGAGIEAVTLGVSPAWEAYAAKQKETYNYKETRYQIHDGLDCSSYVGWAIYNVLETENGKDGYVFSASKMSKELSNRGLGEYIPAKETSHWNWQPGDIASMEDSRHVWIVVGTCEDGSVLLLHCSPPGIFFCGTKLPDGSKSAAVSLAEHIMKIYYPEWYERFPKCYRSNSYLTETSVMRWSREVLSDEEGLTTMSAEEIVALLFDHSKD